MPAPQAQPAYLHAAGVPFMVWWHLPQGPASGCPVLLCPASGDEAIGAYRGWRDLALALAQAGRPVLRLDWPGDGDSFDGDSPDGQIGLWRAALVAAIEALKARTGSATVWLLGLRLGALVAADVAAQRPDVAGLVLLAAPPSGRAWLREMRLLAGPSATQPLAPGEVAAGGFVIDTATAAQWTAWSWPSDGQGPPSLLLDRTDRPWPASVLAALQSGFTPLRQVLRDDLADLTSTAHAAQWPADLAQQVLAWVPEARANRPALEPGGEAGVPGGALRRMPSAEVQTAVQSEVRDAVRGEAQGEVQIAMQAGVQEQAVSYAPGRWGVFSEPAGQDGGPAAPTGQAVLLLSSGADRRIGPHRLWVPWARARACQGDRVLRVDLSGFGDSGCRGVSDVAEAIYDARCVDQDIAAAVAWLRQRGAVAVTLVGLCSGAHHAWRAAVQRVAVDAVVPINPMIFHWKPGTALDPARMAFGQIHIAAAAGQSLRDPARWRKLLRGQVHVGVILRAVAARAGLAVRAGLRDVARRLRWPLHDDLGSELLQVARRGVGVRFIFSADDPGRALLVQEAGAAWSRVVRDGRAQLGTILDADHTFSTPASRERLYNQLHQFVAPVNSPLSPRSAVARGSATRSTS